MRVLILSANTGGGHNSTARALAEQLEALGAEYEIADTLAFISERVSDFISWGHSYVYRRLPRLFGFGYRYEEKHSPHFMYEQCAKGVDALKEKLESEPFDAVLCVHVFSGLMMTELRRRYHNNIPAFFIATDYTCSPGCSEFTLDGYFIPHRMLLGEFVRAGLPADKLFAFGIPVAGCFHEETDKAAARRELEFSENGKVALLSCGSMGCGKLDKNALMICERMPKDATLVVLCGKNEKLYESLRPAESKRMRVLGYTDQVALYMSAADLYITKPGGLTTSEALAKRLPMIFIEAVPGLETRNYDFLIGNGVATGSKNWRHVSALVQRSLRDSTLLAQQVEAMKKFTAHNAAELICRHVTDYVNRNLAKQSEKQME